MILNCSIALMVVGCVTLPQPPWGMVSVAVDGRGYAIPVRRGWQEHCTGDQAVFKVRAAQLAPSVRLIACMTNEDGALHGLATVLTRRGLRTADFSAYKDALRQQVKALSDAVASGHTDSSAPEANSAQVLKILDEGKHWVVHAVLRRGQTLQTTWVGVVGSALVRDRLFYLSVLMDGSDAVTPDWPRLQAMATDWTERLIVNNEWRP